MTSLALDPVDRKILRASQGGLPLCPRPYHALAEQLDLDPADVMARFRRLLGSGVVRRIGAVPNHYVLGWQANGMSVWDIDDRRIGEVGPKVGALPFVTHCYRRPRRPPLWPYNLFAMVHGRTRDEVDHKVSEIRSLLGPSSRRDDVLFSTRILKKTGLRLT